MDASSPLIERRSSSISAPLSLLADVELQLCMHFLEATEIMRWARCSTRMMHASAAPFAWHDALLRIDSHRLEQARSLRLLQHVPVAVRLTGVGDDWTPDALRNHLDALLALVPRLYQLHLSDASAPGGAAMQPHHWRRLLRHPSARQLRALTMQRQWGDAQVDSDTLRMLARLPLLHSLSVHAADPATPIWSPLPSFPALTSLDVRDAGHGQDGTVLPFVAQCPRLVQLRIFEPALSGLRWHSFFSAPRIRQLQRLSLCRFRCSGWFADGPPTAHIAAAFRALHSLRTLELSEIHGVETMMAELHHAPALRLLLIEPLSVTAWWMPRRSCPSLRALALLLRDAPLLEVRLSPPQFTAPHARHAQLSPLDLLAVWRDKWAIGYRIAAHLPPFVGRFSVCNHDPNSVDRQHRPRRLPTEALCDHLCGPTPLQRRLANYSRALHFLLASVLPLHILMRFFPPPPVKVAFGAPTDA